MLNKLLSGRFILTVICGLVFGYVAIKMILPPEQTATILTMVFVSYFQKNRTEQKGEQQK